MPADFNEKSGLVWSCTNWGRWTQTVQGLVVQVNINQIDLGGYVSPIRSKDIKVDVSAKKIRCAIRENVIFEVCLHHLWCLRIADLSTRIEIIVASIYRYTTGGKCKLFYRFSGIFQKSLPFSLSGWALWPDLGWRDYLDVGGQESCGDQPYQS